MLNTRSRNNKNRNRSAITPLPTSITDLKEYYKGLEKPIGPIGTYHGKSIYSYQNAIDNTDVFNAYLKTIMNKSSIQDKMILIYLLLTFYPTKFDDIIPLLKTDLSNNDIVEGFVKKYNLEAKAFENPRKINDIMHIIIKKTKHCNKQQYKFPIDTLLDVGCGDGSIMYKLRDAGLVKRVMGIEIETWSQISRDSSKNNPDINIINDKAPIFPIADGSIDMITCFYSLHHFTELDRMMKEIARVCKKGGFVLIQEHDIWTRNQALIVDFVHIIHEYNRTHQFPKRDTYFSRYYNYWAWDKIFAENGFEYVYASHELSLIPHNINHLMKFYGFYQKI